MRASRIAFDSASPLTASHRILGESTQRVGLKIFPPVGGSVTLSNDPAVVLNQGITLNQSQPWVSLHIEVDGDILQREWYAIYSAGANAIGWIEVMQ